MKANITEHSIEIDTADSTSVGRMVIWNDGTVLIYWGEFAVSTAYIYHLEGGLAEALSLIHGAGGSAGRAANAIKKAATGYYNSARGEFIHLAHA